MIQNYNVLDVFFRTKKRGHGEKQVPVFLRISLTFQGIKKNNNNNNNKFPHCNQQRMFRITPQQRSGHFVWQIALKFRGSMPLSKPRPWGLRKHLTKEVGLTMFDQNFCNWILPWPLDTKKKTKKMEMDGSLHWRVKNPKPLPFTTCATSFFATRPGRTFRP